MLHALMGMFYTFREEAPPPPTFTLFCSTESLTTMSRSILWHTSRAMFYFGVIILHLSFSSGKFPFHVVLDSIFPLIISSVSDTSITEI